MEKLLFEIGSLIFMFLAAGLGWILNHLFGIVAETSGYESLPRSQQPWLGWFLGGTAIVFNAVILAFLSSLTAAVFAMAFGFDQVGFGLVAAIAFGYLGADTAIFRFAEGRGWFSPTAIAA